MLFLSSYPLPYFGSFSVLSGFLISLCFPSSQFLRKARNWCSQWGCSGIWSAPYLLKLKGHWTCMRLVLIFATLHFLCVFLCWGLLFFLFADMLLNLTGTAVASSLMDKQGRKKLLMASFSGMVSLLMFANPFFLHNLTIDSKFKWVSFSGALLLISHSNLHMISR